MSKELKFSPEGTIAQELSITAKQVEAVITMLSEGNTVPFIARYRKEKTQSLDEVQIRSIEERLQYLRELFERKQTILKTIAEQDKLTPELEQKIIACDSKATLEDLYLPYKPKKRTRATIAKEKGLEPLAKVIWTQEKSIVIEEFAKEFIDGEKGVESVHDAIAGAKDIVAEWISEDADLRSLIRQYIEQSGFLLSQQAKTDSQEPTKYEQYYEFKSKLNDIPSHRFLAVRRGEKEGILRTSIEVDTESLYPMLLKKLPYENQSPLASLLVEALYDSYKRLIAPSIESDLRTALKMQSDRSAVDVFSNNLENLLLAAPLGSKSVIGVDPGIRTGCKCVAIDETGDYQGTITIYPQSGQEKKQQAQVDFVAFVTKHQPYAIAIGNGTASRETERFIRAILPQEIKENTIIVQVNEAGASVYSASEIARQEFPDLDVTVRGAISIARRLQDPLAELVKIDPKSIGVGQYQHDVFQSLLKKRLDQVVESCVNKVGVDLNTASYALLAYVSGVGNSIAKKITTYRKKNGPFHNRQQLLKVPGMGPKSFEQSAGFLRIRNGDNVLDNSAVHPERYELVQQIAHDNQIVIADLIGNNKVLNSLSIESYCNDDVGRETLHDIMDELLKPGLDPRDDFQPPKFRDDVQEMSDLKIGMQLEGQVTNVTNFGAFVDIGVHQDGLIHISELANHFVKDPHTVVSVGDKLKVKVLDVDLVRNRISLSAKLDGSQPANQKQSTSQQNLGSHANKKPPKKKGFSNNPFKEKLLQR